MSKDSLRRPQQAADKTVENNWNRIFRSTRENPVPTGKVASFGSTERGYTLYTASIFPEAYEAVNDVWLMGCDVSRTSANGTFAGSLKELIDSGHLKHEAEEFEALEVDGRIIDEITKWAKDNGVVYTY